MRSPASFRPGSPTRATPSADPPDRPLTVGYILKMFPRFSETFILNEILELERRGLRIVVFSMKTPNETLRQPRVRQVRAPIWVIPSFRGSQLWPHIISHLGCLLRFPKRYITTLLFVWKRRTRAAWSKFFFAPYIVRQARAAGVEHFHAHFASGPARQAKLASLLSGIPFSFTAHAKDLFWDGHQHGNNHKLKKRVRLASFVVTISEYNRTFVEGLNFTVPRRRLITVYNGLDLDRWPLLRPDGLPRNGSPGARPLIIAVGRLVPKKGFPVLVEACSILATQMHDFTCVIAGDGPEKEHLRALVRRYGLKDRVLLPGSIPQDRLVTEFLTRASLLVQPSVVAADGDQDGIPTVILEALASGLPVVATAVSGIGEAVSDGETGLLVHPGDPTALAAAMRAVLADPSLAARLATGGRRLAETRFNLKNNAKVLIHLMDHAAHGTLLWSQAKLRERVGLKPVTEPAPGANEVAGGPTGEANEEVATHGAAAES
jgi:glycosyltransferase involved in cell wall biosynthesis